MSLSASSHSTAPSLGAHSAAGSVALHGNQLIQQVRFLDESSPSGLIRSVAAAMGGSDDSSASGRGGGGALSAADETTMLLQARRRQRSIAGMEFLAGGGGGRGGGGGVGGLNTTPSPPRGSVASNSGGSSAAPSRIGGALGGDRDRGRRGTAVGLSSAAPVIKMDDYYAKNSAINPKRRMSVAPSGWDGSSARHRSRSPSLSASSMAGAVGIGIGDDDGTDGAIVTALATSDPNYVLTTIAASDYFLAMKDFFAPPHTDAVAAIAVDPIATGRLYSASLDDTIGAWVPGARERVATLPHSDWVNCVIVLRLRGYLASEADKAVSQRHGGLGGGQREREGAVEAEENEEGEDASSSPHQREPASFTFVVSGSEDGHVSFWSPAHGNKMVHQVRPCHGAPITALSSYRDIVFAASLRTVFVISAVSGTVVRALTDASADVTCLAFVDGSLLCGLTDGRVAAWDIVEGIVIREIYAHGTSAASSATASNTAGGSGGLGLGTTGGGIESGVRCLFAPALEGFADDSEDTPFGGTVTAGGSKGSSPSTSAGTTPSAPPLFRPTRADQLYPPEVLASAASYRGVFFTAGDDGLIKAWSASTGVCLRTIDNNAVAVPRGGRGGLLRRGIESGPSTAPSNSSNSNNNKVSPVGSIGIGSASKTTAAAQKTFASASASLSPRAPPPSSVACPIRAMAHHFRGGELFLFAATANAKITCHAINARKAGVIHSAMANAMAVWHDPHTHSSAAASSAASPFAAPMGSEPVLVVGDHSGLLQMLPILNPEANVIAGTCIA